MSWMLLCWIDLALLWKGMSPCMNPGVGECVVWWEAWAVVVGIVVGITTAVIAILAWLTSREATRIAADARSIAEAQRGAEVKARAASARIVGRLLAYELIALPDRLKHRLEVAEKMLIGKGGAVMPANLLKGMAETVLEPILPNAERVIDRIDTLPDKLGAELATMISHCRDIAAAAEKIREGIVEEASMTTGARGTYHYQGGSKRIESLIRKLEFVSGLAPQLTLDFDAFVLSDGAGTTATDAGVDE